MDLHERGRLRGNREDAGARQVDLALNGDRAVGAVLGEQAHAQPLWGADHQVAPGGEAGLRAAGLGACRGREVRGPAGRRPGLAAALKTDALEGQDEGAGRMDLGDLQVRARPVDLAREQIDPHACLQAQGQVGRNGLAQADCERSRKTDLALRSGALDAVLPRDSGLGLGEPGALGRLADGSERPACAESPSRDAVGGASVGWSPGEAMPLGKAIDRHALGVAGERVLCIRGAHPLELDGLAVRGQDAHDSPGSRFELKGELLARAGGQLAGERESRGVGSDPPLGRHGRAALAAPKGLHRQARHEGTV